MNNIPTTQEEAFKDLLNKAHAREGDYLSPSTLNMLSYLADEMGLSWDDHRRDDAEIVHTEYGEHEPISDDELAEYI